MADQLPMLFLKAVPGRRVRDPEIPTRILSEDGDYKPDNSFWRLRLRDGDVVEALPPDATPEAKQSKSAKAKE